MFCVPCLLGPAPARTFLFALTVEGVEVWTFPSDDKLSEKLSEAGRRAGEREWSEEGEGSYGRVGGALSLSSLSPHPSPRPCLLHVQEFEVSVPGAKCLIWVGTFSFPLSGAASNSRCRGGELSCLHLYIGRRLLGGPFFLFIHTNKGRASGPTAAGPPVVMVCCWLWWVSEDAV